MVFVLRIFFARGRLRAQTQRSRKTGRAVYPCIATHACVDRHPGHTVVFVAGVHVDRVAGVADVYRCLVQQRTITGRRRASKVARIRIFLLILQGLAELIKRIAYLRGLIADPLTPLQHLR